MSEMVETALRLLLRSQRKHGKISALPTFRSGGELVDIADRDALYSAMEYPYLSDNILHGAHTAILMRQHGIGRICTRDTDFSRFKFLEIVDPAGS